MKPNRLLFRIALLFFAALPALAGELSFELVSSTDDAVALQFDVSSTGSPVSFGTPVFQGASPHRVESNTIASGTTRFVLYTTTGLPISPTGVVRVTFSSPELADGMLTVTGVMASDADGVETGAAPNSLPVIVTGAPVSPSQQVGVPTTLSATAYDLDGTIAQMSFREGGAAFASATSFQPGSVSWVPLVSGVRELSVTAEDSIGGETTTVLGEVRTYTLSELDSFAAFEAIHFGSGANPANLGFETAPFGHGIPNGLAWLLGINPNAPDFTKLPSASIENTGSGSEFVFRFNRLGSLTGGAWHVLESPTLEPDSWDPVQPGWITETPVGDGTVDVEVRKPIDPVTDPKTFLTLEAIQQP
jgi:hypothetical protein